MRIREHYCSNCGAPQLTRSEVQILDLLAKGRGTREVASTLYLSVETVRWHLKNSYRHLKAHSRAEAIARARAFRLIDSTEGASAPVSLSPTEGSPCQSAVSTPDAPS